MVTPRQLLSTIESSLLAPTPPSPAQRIELLHAIRTSLPSFKSLFIYPPPKDSDRVQVQSKEVRLPDAPPISLDDQDVQIVLKLSDDLHLNEIDCVQLLVSANQEWGLMGRQPLEIFRLAAGLWYTERRDLLTALYTLFRAVVLDQGLPTELLSEIQKHLEDLINGGLRQRLISLIKELNREEPAGLGGPQSEPYVLDSRGSLVERRSVVSRERLVVGHCLVLSVLVVRTGSKDVKDIFQVYKDSAAELTENISTLKRQVLLLSFCLLLKFSVFFALVIAFVSDALSAVPEKKSILSLDSNFRKEFQEIVMSSGNDLQMEGFIGGVRLAWSVHLMLVFDGNSPREATSVNASNDSGYLNSCLDAVFANNVFQFLIDKILGTAAYQVKDSKEKAKILLNSNRLTAPHDFTQDGSYLSQSSVDSGNVPFVSLLEFVSEIYKVMEHGPPIERKDWFPEIEPLFKLLSYENVPPYLKGALRDAITTFVRVSPVLKDAIWRYLEQYDLPVVLGGNTGTGVPPMGAQVYDMQYELNEVEARRERYPSTISFLNLLNTLIAEEKDSADRGRRAYADPVEKWQLVIACLQHFHMMLSMYDIHDGDIDSIVSQSQLSPVAQVSQLQMQLPVLELLKDFMSGKTVFRNIMSILLPGVNSIISERNSQIHGHLLEKAVQLSLDIINLVLQKDSLVSDYWRPLYQPLDVILSQDHNQIIALLEYVRYDFLPQIQQCSIKIMSILSSRMVGLVQLLLKSNAAASLVEDYAACLELRSEECQVIETSADDAGVLIMQLLIDNIGRPAPNITHLLLKFDVDTSVDRTVLQPKFHFSCLKVILEILEDLTKPEINSVLHEFGFQLLYELCSDPITCGPTMDLLSNKKYQFFIKHLDTIGVAPLPKRNINQPLRISSLHQRAWLLKLLAIELHSGYPDVPSHGEACQSILSHIFGGDIIEMGPGHMVSDFLLRNGIEHNGSQTMSKSKVLELLEVVQFQSPDATVKLPQIISNAKYALLAEDILGDPTTSMKGGIYYYSERGDRLIDLASFRDKLWLKFNTAYPHLGNLGNEAEFEDVREAIQHLLRWGWKHNKNLEEQAAQLHMLTGWSHVVEVHALCLLDFCSQYALLLSYFQYCQHTLDPDVPTTVLQFLLLEEQDNEDLDLIDREQAELARVNFTIIRKEGQAILDLIIKDATHGSEPGKTIALYVLDALICIDHERYFLSQLQSRGFLRSCFMNISNTCYQDGGHSLDSLQRACTLEAEFELLLRISQKYGKSGSQVLFSMGALEHIASCRTVTLQGSLRRFDPKVRRNVAVDVDRQRMIVTPILRLVSSLTSLIDTSDIFEVKNKIVREVIDFVKGHQLLFDQILHVDIHEADELTIEQVNLAVGILSKVWPYEESDEFGFVQSLFSMMSVIFSRELETNTTGRSLQLSEHRRKFELNSLQVRFSLSSYLYFLVMKKSMRLQVLDSVDYQASVGVHLPTLRLLGSLLSFVATSLEKAADDKSMLLNKIRDINELSRQEVDEIINMCVRQEAVSPSDGIQKRRYIAMVEMCQLSGSRDQSIRLLLPLAEQVLNIILVHLQESSSTSNPCGSGAPKAITFGREGNYEDDEVHDVSSLCGHLVPTLERLELLNEDKVGHNLKVFRRLVTSLKETAIQKLAP
ncbi:Nuclear pore complex protein NUP205 [Linum perenne]